MLLMSIGLPASAQSAFCRTGSDKLMMDGKEATLDAVAATCKLGDTIAIPPGGGAAGYATFARLCDFSKAMPIVGGMLICVLGEKKELR